MKNSVTGLVSFFLGDIDFALHNTTDEKNAAGKPTKNHSKYD